MEELAGTVRSIARATGLPLIVDGDTGYGEALNAMRLVRELEDAGAAAVHIEDQVLPKKCGHLNDKTLVPTDQMAAKVAAARKARRHLVIIARTDAAASEGLQGAIARARAYAAAGADVVFPDALTSLEEFRAFASAVPVPTMCNMTEFGRTPPVDAAALDRRYQDRHLAGLVAAHCRARDGGVFAARAMARPRRNSIGCRRASASTS